VYDWKAIVLNPDDDMEKAILVLNEEALGIVLVADQVGKLLGTVTDGDIRRALINQKGMDALLTDVMRSEPVTAPFDETKDELLAIMKRETLLQLPLVDQKGRIVGLETIQKLLHAKTFDNPVFLMAGGFGKRLQPLTNDIPKPLLHVGSKPILETILNRFIDAGFHNFFISTHYKAEMIRQHFGDGDRWGVTIQYIHEDEPLGTAGALGLLPCDLPDLPMIMINGDVLTMVDFDRLLNFHNEQGGIATMCVREYDFQVPYGVVETDGCCVSNIAEKPVHNFFVNAGVYVLERQLIDQVSGVKYLDMPHLLEQQIESGEQVNSFPIHEYWLDVGRPEEYDRANYEAKSLGV